MAAMRKIKLSQGKHALVDDEDYDWLSQWNWTLLKHPKDRMYAYRKIGNKTTLMHRVILGAKKGQVCDHKNRNGLDNRRDNLRFCSNQQNAFNSIAKRRNGKSSKFKGVHWCNTRGHWIAKTRVGNKRIQACSDNELEAARLWNEMAKKHHGEFARLNDV